MSAISNDWLEGLKPEFGKPYYASLYKTILQEYNSRQIFPAAEDISVSYTHLTLPTTSRV